MNERHLRHGLLCIILASCSLALAQTSVPVGPASLQDYVYATPPGWTANQYPDGIVLQSPVSQTGERCMISMWPMRPTSGNLLSDAVTAFQQIYSTYEPRNRTSDGAPIEASLVRGASGNGWDYLIVKQGIGKPGGQWESLLGFVMVAKLNNRVAVISGLSKEPLRSACMGELTGANTWPRFFYNLGFRNWTPQDQSATMRNKIAGTWTMATGTAATQITLAANGRYADAAAAQQYNRLNNSEVLRTTQAYYFGNGAYTLKGNTISFTPDNKGKPPDSGFYRLEEESKDGGRTWTQSLYIMRTSTVDGQEYEVRYKK